MTESCSCGVVPLSRCFCRPCRPGCRCRFRTSPSLHSSSAGTSSRSLFSASKLPASAASSTSITCDAVDCGVATAAGRGDGTGRESARSPFTQCCRTTAEVPLSSVLEIEAIRRSASLALSLRGWRLRLSWTSWQKPLSHLWPSRHGSHLKPRHAHSFFRPRRPAHASRKMTRHR